MQCSVFVAKFLQMFKRRERRAKKTRAGQKESRSFFMPSAVSRLTNICWWGNEAGWKGR